jgi:hypothetical protein
MNMIEESRSAGGTTFGRNLIQNEGGDQGRSNKKSGYGRGKK